MKIRPERQFDYDEMLRQILDAKNPGAKLGEFNRETHDWARKRGREEGRKEIIAAESGRAMPRSNWRGRQDVSGEERNMAPTPFERRAKYAEHQDNCIRSYCQGGEPTADGKGYQRMYRGKWYQVRPVDETPPCECGLNALLAEGEASAATPLSSSPNTASAALTPPPPSLKVVKER